MSGVVLLFPAWSSALLRRRTRLWAPTPHPAGAGIGTSEGGPKKRRGRPRPATLLRMTRASKLRTVIRPAKPDKGEYFHGQE